MLVSDVFSSKAFFPRAVTLRPFILSGILSLLSEPLYFVMVIPPSPFSAPSAFSFVMYS